jgi:hypothetical protein
MSLPSNVDFGTVVGRFLIATQDSADAGLFPDGAPASGTISFLPQVEKLRNPTALPAPVTIIPTTITCTLDSEGYLIGPNGSRGVKLIATNDLDNNPTGWTWRVVYNLTNQAGSRISGPGSYELSVPANEITDLITDAPVSGLGGQIG